MIVAAEGSPLPSLKSPLGVDRSRGDHRLDTARRALRSPLSRIREVYPALPLGSCDPPRGWARWARYPVIRKKWSRLSRRGEQAGPDSAPSLRPPSDGVTGAGVGVLSPKPHYAAPPPRVAGEALAATLRAHPNAMSSSTEVAEEVGAQVPSVKGSSSARVRGEKRRVRPG